MRIPKQTCSRDGFSYPNSSKTRPIEKCSNLASFLLNGLPKRIPGWYKFDLKGFFVFFNIFGIATDVYMSKQNSTNYSPIVLHLTSVYKVLQI